jgi:hypothetical protein
MGIKSVMDAEPSAEEIAQFEAHENENRLIEEEFEREIAAAKGEKTQSQFNPQDGTDPRNQRVEDSERDARLRHKDYFRMVENYVVPLIRQRPEVFTILRDTVDAGEAAYQLARLIQNPKLAEQPEFKGFSEYLRDVGYRKTGKFDNLSVTDFEQVLENYKEHSDEGETIEEFFTR